MLKGPFASITAALFIFFVSELPSAKANECDDAHRKFDAARTLQSIHHCSAFQGLSPDDLQKCQCEASRMNSQFFKNWYELFKQAERVCGRPLRMIDPDGKVEPEDWWPKIIADGEKNVAHDCDFDARRAERPKEDDPRASNACIELSSEASTGIKDAAEVHQKNLKLCNSSPVECKAVLEFVHNFNKPVPEGMACDGH